MEPTPAGLFASRFQILEKLGSGGFGTVYRAYDSRLRIEVALKVTNSAVSDPDVIARFEREARVIAKLNHENIVKVFDCGVHEGSPYYAMEFVAGDPLNKVMETSRVMTPRAAARIARDVALALHHAHLNGVLHRDVKPHNVIIQPKEGAGSKSTRRADETVSSSRGAISEYRTVLTDFGLARDSAAVTKLSVTGEVMGTPMYMAPEMAQGDSRAVGPHTDVYSLGVVLYHLLSGALPFRGASFPELLVAIVTDDPVPLKGVAPHLPPDLCAIVAKAMDRDIAHRYRTALALAEDLECFLQGEPVSAKPPPISVKVRRWMGRHLALCASAASAALVGIALAGWFLLVAPELRASKAREELEQARRTFVTRRAAIEGEARAARAGIRDGARADAYVQAFGRYRLARGFPQQEFDWRPEFAEHVPFDIPLVGVHLEVARACEHDGRRAEAMRHHLRAYFAWIDRPEGENALVELAQFMLRAREFAHAAHFFRKLETTDPARARAGLAFALAGLGRFDEAATMLRETAPAPAPAVRPEGRLRAIHDGELTAESLTEAARLASIFAGRVDVGAWDRPDLHVVGDLDGDGRAELLLPMDGRIDVYGAEGGGLRKIRSIATDFPRGRPALVDLDADGRPELVVCTSGFRAFRIAGERLELLAEAAGPPAHGLWALDVDGDGTREVVAIGSQIVVVYRKGPRGYAALEPLRYPSTDPIHVDARDVDGDGRPELVVATGTWAESLGFRLWTYTIDGGRLRARSRPIGWVTGAISTASLDGQPVWHTTTGSWGGYARALGKRYESLGLAPELGLIRVACGPDGPQAPELLWGRRVERWGDVPASMAAFTLGGRPGAYAWVDGDARLVLLDTLAYLPVPLPPDNVQFADLDGDGDPEAVMVRGGRLEVSGLPGAARSGGLVEAERRNPASARALEYQDAVMTLPRDPAAMLEDLIARFPEYEKELLLRLADAHARAWRWEEAAKVLDRVQTTFFLGEAEAVEVGAKLKTAREAAGVAESLAVDFTKETLLTNAPLKYRIDGGVLRAYGNSKVPAFLAIPVKSEERSGGVTMRALVHRLDYVTSFAVGMSDAVDRAAWDQDLLGAWRSWKRTAGISTAGSGDTPGSTGVVGAPGGMATIPNIAVRPGPDPFTIDVDWVPGADAIRATFRHGSERFEAVAPLGMRGPPADAFLILTTGHTAYVGDDYWTEIEIGKLALKGAAARRAFVPATAADYYARGGGRFVSGDYAGAVEDWKRALAGLEGELYGMKPEDAALEVAFLSACAHVRAGRRGEADASMDAVFAGGAEKALGIFKRNFLGMRADEQDVFRDALWRAFEGRPVQEAFDAIMKRVRILPGGGLLVWEILLFDEPKLKGLDGFADDVERRFNYGGRSTAVLRRAKAKLRRAEGNDEEALRLLDQGIEAIRGPDVDEFNRWPLERELLRLKKEWGR